MAAEEKNYPGLIIKTRENTHAPNGTTIKYRLKKDSPFHRDMVNHFRDRILTDLSNAPSGLYTWIARGTKEDNTIYASQTRSKQELGTLHKNLFDLTKYKDKRPLFAAGELKIDSQGAIEFNLQSGLFNDTVLKAYKTNKTKSNFVTKTVVPAVINTLQRTGVSRVEYLVCDDESCDETEITGGRHILSKEPIISTEENIAIYNRFFNRLGASSGGSKRSDQKRSDQKRSDQKRSDQKRSDQKRSGTKRSVKSEAAQSEASKGDVGQSDMGKSEATKRKPENTDAKWISIFLSRLDIKLK